MDIIIATFTIALGLFIFSFTVGNIVLISLFSIPLTNKLDELSLLRSGHNIVGSYLVALTLQVLVLGSVTAVFYFLLRDSAFISLLIGYGIGLIAFVLSIKKFGVNSNNLTDYFDRNKQYLWPELISKYEEDRDEFFRFIQSCLAHRQADL